MASCSHRHLGLLDLDTADGLVSLQIAVVKYPFLATVGQHDLAELTLVLFYSRVIGATVAPESLFLEDTILPFKTFFALILLFLGRHSDLLLLFSLLGGRCDANICAGSPLVIAAVGCVVLERLVGLLETSSELVFIVHEANDRV